MADKQLVVVENGMVDLWKFDPKDAYEVEKRDDGILVFTPIISQREVDLVRASAAAAAREEALDAIDEYPPGVTITPIFGNPWSPSGD